MDISTQGLLSKVLVGEINASIQGVHCLVGVAGDLGLGFLKNMMGIQ